MNEGESTIAVDSLDQALSEIDGDSRMQIYSRPWARPRRRWPLAAIPASLLLLWLGGCGNGGKPEAVWCETGTGPAEVVFPRGITYDSASDTFYIIDRIAHVQRLDHNGHCLAEWQTPDWSMAREGGTGEGVGPDGNLWIPDTHNHRIVVYTPQGKLLEKFGSE